MGTSGIKVNEAGFCLMALIRSIPNLLGLLRILGTPFLMWLILMGSPSAYLWAALLLLAMVVSDLLDGFLARYLQVVSRLGIFLDTISDKIFVTGVLLPMVQGGLLSGWIALVIIVREFVVSGLRSFAASEGKVISAGRLGKQKLAITVAALVWRLVAAAVEAGSGHFARSDFFALFMGFWPVAMAAAVIWTVISGVDYVWRAWPLLQMGWSSSDQEAASAGSAGSSSSSAQAVKGSQTTR